MKSKLIIGILVIAVLLCQGVAFAESVNAVETAKATAEDAVTDDEGSLGTTMLDEENAAPADELYTPAAEPVKAETAAVPTEAKKM